MTDMRRDPTIFWVLCCSLSISALIMHFASMNSVGKAVTIYSQAIAVDTNVADNEKVVVDNLLSRGVLQARIAAVPAGTAFLMLLGGCYVFRAELKNSRFQSRLVEVTAAILILYVAMQFLII